MQGLKIMPVNQGSDFENRNQKNNLSVGVVGPREYPQSSATAQEPPASSGFEPNTSELGLSRSGDGHDDEVEEEVMVETNISKLLSERTTKVVIIIVLIMLFF